MRQVSRGTHKRYGCCLVCGRNSIDAKCYRCTKRGLQSKPRRITSAIVCPFCLAAFDRGARSSRWRRYCSQVCASSAAVCRRWWPVEWDIYRLLNDPAYFGPRPTPVSQLACGYGEGIDLGRKARALDESER